MQKYYIIFNNNEFDNSQFIKTPVYLSDAQSIVELTSSELNNYLGYKYYNKYEINLIQNDTQTEDTNLQKLYITRIIAAQDPNAYEIFLQDYSVLEGNPLGQSIFTRALTYNDQTFTQWMQDLEGNPIGLNTDGRFFRAVVGSFAIVLKGLPSESGGITEQQRQELDYILRPMMNDVYTGNWRTAAEYYYFGYPSLGVPSIKSLLPVELLPTFALLEAQLDSYLARFYTDENGNPLVINPS